MMDFMDNLRRGVDRAGFEVDRMLRANRVRSGIGNIRSQIDDEFRQIGRQIMEMYDRREPLPEQVRARCEQVKRYEEEIAQREIELEAITSESPPDVEPGPIEAATSTCWNCGQTVSTAARFCPNCGVSLTAPAERSEPTLPGTPPPPAG